MRVTPAVAVAVDSPYVCDVAVVAAVSAHVAEALTAQPTCPEPGRVNATPAVSTPLLIRIDAAAANRTVVELTVLVIEEDSVPLPVAVTITVLAVAFSSSNLKNATPFTKCAFVNV
jgi:hypothetical protein